MTAGTNASYTFTLNDGDSWEVLFNSGTFDNEVIYTFTDCNGIKYSQMDQTLQLDLLSHLFMAIQHLTPTPGVLQLV